MEFTRSALASFVQLIINTLSLDNERESNPYEVPFSLDHHDNSSIGYRMIRHKNLRTTNGVVTLAPLLGTACAAETQVAPRTKTGDVYISDELNPKCATDHRCTHRCHRTAGTTTHHHRPAGCWGLGVRHSERRRNRPGVDPTLTRRPLHRTRRVHHRRARAPTADNERAATHRTVLAGRPGRTKRTTRSTRRPPKHPHG